VDARHRHVKSAATDDVAYDADAQLWVAACMFVGARQAVESFRGPLERRDAEELLGRCGAFATTLQVPTEMWPDSLAAFERYWSEVLGRVKIDEVTRRYLEKFIGLDFVPAGLRWCLRRPHRLLIGGFLPQPFRDALHLRWELADQRRFLTLMRRARRYDRVMPKWWAEFPWNLLRWTIQRRTQRGRALL
jgi:uncharacterized protein (DUF2236 family)